MLAKLALLVDIVVMCSSIVLVCCSVLLKYFVVLQCSVEVIL